MDTLFFFLLHPSYLEIGYYVRRLLMASMLCVIDRMVIEPNGSAILLIRSICLLNLSVVSP